jgi:rhodanese-related sulfurtransferase
MSSEPVSAPSSAIPEITREELQRRLHDPSLVLVDVLPPDTYAAGHIPRALSLPLAEMFTHAPELLPDRAAEIVVYCAKFT